MDSNEFINGLKASNDPTLLYLLGILEQAKRTPTFEMDRSQPYGSYSASKNNIKFNPITGNNRQTFAHELTHAVDSAMSDHAYAMDDRSISERGILHRLMQPRATKDPDFTDAYKKLQPYDTKTTDVKKQQEERPYRFRSGEMRAHAIENTMPLPLHLANIPKFNPVQNHVDPTLATEALILMDLYTRSLNKQKK